jgi:Tol biopolymer transport system component
VRRRIPFALAALLLLAAAFPAGAFAFGKNKIAYERFDWHVYRSPHFDVYYYPEEEPLLQQVVSDAESQYMRLSQILDHEIKFRIPLIYYKTHVEFEQTNIILEFIPEAVGAFAHPIEHRMVLPMDMPPDKKYSLIGHELTHIFEYSILYQESLSRAFRSNVPGWIMEGLASHLGQDEDNFDKTIIRDAVVNGLIPPIHRVQVLNFMTYRYGQAAFDFIEENYGSEGIRNFLWEFRKSLLANNVAKPIKDAFGVEADEFDRQFKKFLQKRYLPALLDKKEAEDYGKEIAPPEKRPSYEEGHLTLSPALSPSGELIAALTTRYEDWDVVVISAKDGKIFRNLTKGFTNKFEYPVLGGFQLKKDLTWSPEGDRLAFFARRENERALMIYDAVRGDLERMVSIPGVDDELSPAWSPDGKKIAFEGNQGGQVDLFTLDLDSGETRNLTQDEFYDGNPAWSPDGTQILYNRRINASEKIFLVDVADPSRKVQLTFGDSSDIQPSFSKDGKRVWYSSDAYGGIFNLHVLALDTGEIRRQTDILGGVFTPLELPDENGKPSLAYTYFGGGRFRLFRTSPGEPEAIQHPADQAREPAELQPFQAPLQLTLDADKKKPYDKLRFHVESAPSVLVGVADDGTVLSNAQIILSDLLGDHRMFFDFQSVSTFSNFNYAYLNLKNRWNWGVFATDFRDFYVVRSAFSNATLRTRQFSRFTGAGAQISYPFNKFYRVGASAGYFQRDINRPLGLDASTLLPVFAELKEGFPLFTWSLSGDTTRFKEFGPYHGQRFELTQEWAPTVSASGDTDLFRSGPFVDSILDYRLYRRATSRSLLALRLVGLVSNGNGFNIRSIGGLNQLRGYDYREFFGSRTSFMNLEFRFPLVDALAFPFGIIRDIRGFLFLDVGSAWFGGGEFFHPRLGFETTSAVQGKLNPDFIAVDGSGNPVRRRFRFWDSENSKLGDGRASYGFGWGFYLGPFQLTWSFAKQLPNTIEVCDSALPPPSPCTITRIDDPFHEGGTVTQFYIAREF